MQTEILGTGLSGLVGTRVVELLSGDFHFTDISYDTGVDITDYDQVIKRFEESDAKTVLHMAAKTDVDGCEDDKILGEEGPAWMINVIGTENIVAASKKTNKRLIYISTDFVFNGTKDRYTEDDEPDPINWYSVTKYEGERLVSESRVPAAVVRLSYPYRSSFPARVDFVRRIIQKAKEGGEIKALTDHIFTPTFIDDIAFGLGVIFNKELNGVYHLVGSKSLTPYEATKKIFETFKLSSPIIPVKREEYFKERAYRPFKLALGNDKITKFGVKMLSFDQGLKEVLKQL